MSNLSVVCSLLVVVAGNLFALTLLQQIRAQTWRRTIQLLILAAPLVGLGLALGTDLACSSVGCLASADTGSGWLAVVDRGLSLGMGGVALGAIGLGVVRLWAMERVVARGALPATPALQTHARVLARRLGVVHPRVLVCAHARPLALTFGLRRPTILLSQWMVERLDRRELEAVLAHELAHAARKDYLVIWLATILRDAFCYLPTSWVAYRQLHQEKEIACDDLAVRVTRRPLGLASALAKVWQQALIGPALHPAPALVDPGEVLEGRITRLLETPPPAAAPLGQQRRPLVASASALGGLLAVGTLWLVTLLAMIGCGPTSPLGKLL